MRRHIVIVEDEPAIRANYSEALERQGYRVSGYGNRAAAQQALASQLPDLVIIDVGLGGEPEGGFELCRALRARSQTLPLVFLTARDSDLDAISGLRLGADDYLTKDISLPHLLTRVHSLLRRVEALREPESGQQVIERGPLRLQVERMAVSWNGTPVPLTVTEFYLVRSLVRYPGHVKNRDQLMGEADMLVDDATITSHIKRIRRKFLAIDDGFDAIETVYGAGYRWRT